MAKSCPAGSQALLSVDVQQELSDDGEEPPSSAQIDVWAQLAYSACRDQVAEMTLRLVGEAEMRELNKQFRGKQGLTNVLSFAADDIPEFLPADNAELEIPLLGDVVICHPVVVAEATEQGKTVLDHYAHLTTHGVLHLCGFDHQSVEQAEEMESLETKILAKQGIANPYQ